MYSSEYPERFYFQYQTEVGPLGITFVEFFTEIFNGCRDFWSLVPQNIGLAAC